MSMETRKPSETEPRLVPAGETPDSGDPGDAKPPESAEDFEHVLRRLIAERDRRAQEA